MKVDMNLQTIASTYYPAYTWLWNTTVTKKEIVRQIDEMYASGIRAFYVIGEPEEFRPTTRRTHLRPEYLSAEYIELLYFAFEYAEKKGMHSWLYNEGGFPSGMACGKIRRLHPELSMKMITTQQHNLPKGEVYETPQKCISTFVEGRRIVDGEVFDKEVLVTQYMVRDAEDAYSIQSDIAVRETTDLFLALTHDALKQRFGAHMGKEIIMMFDDEPKMGTWTEGLEKLFLQKYGYEIEDYMEVIANAKTPVTQEEYQAKIDYYMLCCDLIHDNYFIPMKEWLNQHNMLSVGHLDWDNQTEGVRRMRYGNMLRLLRAYDVPGVDVIWNQITYPTNGRCCKEGNEFFPRLASSAAHQQGHSRCLSESFAVYGAHLTPEEMRFINNYQAVRGISQFNFMVMSFDRKGVMSYQYRPNFISEHTGMNCLRQLNDYTARLSYLLQNSRPDVTSALYFPQRTICADGKAGADAIAAYEAMGFWLEQKGVSFDLVDEEFVLQAQVKDGKLIGKYVTYENIFVPESAFELSEVIEKLKQVGSSIIPCVERTRQEITARKMYFSDKSEGYFICSSGGDNIEDQITVHTEKQPYEIDLYTGDIYELECEREQGSITFSVNFSRGEGMFLWLTDEFQKAKKRFTYENEICIEKFSSFINRRFVINFETGTDNVFDENTERQVGLGAWPKEFSGEVTYQTELPELPDGNLQLDLGKVHHFAKVYLNETMLGEVTMPPYVLPLEGARKGDKLKIVVANTIANVCHDSEFLNRQDLADIGPYHARMIQEEAKASPGGLFGPVWIQKEKQMKE